MRSEINHVAHVLCEVTNTFLENIAMGQHSDLPYYLGFVSRACYVKYDTWEDKITDISIIMIEKNGFAIVADPINGYVLGYTAGEICASVRMRRATAKMLFACIESHWKYRLSTDCLVTANGDGRYVAADLFG